MKRIALLLLSLVSIHNQSICNDSLKFVSFPDFFNFDIPNPWPPWDAAVDYFLTQVKAENPDFVLVAGDLVDGHWWDSPQCIQHLGTLYYSDWVQRMKKHDLLFYTAVGDHELGDDPWPAEKRKLVPYFEKVYRENLKMPSNGPNTKKGLAYYVKKENFLLITVETFEIVNDSMYIDVIGDQLEWFKKVLNENRDVRFKIVQGHVPIWGDLNYRSSSRLMLNNGKQSEFYQTMKQHDIDLYLCGEFHAVTVLESDGIWQIVHGSSWGREMVNTQDYLVAEIRNDNLYLTLKRIYLDAKGDYMWNLNKDKGPREIVEINEKTLIDGPVTIGNLTISKSHGKKLYQNKAGVFNINN
ncbi:MAG: metallophosphoesterase [candidate division KSB1 bacterium]|nr:metallophosphoesterase [candidate division KSB1 bacterium]